MPANLAELHGLNVGLPHYSQVGKFLTIYPATTSEAILLAGKLDAATRGLAGPVIPFDRRFRARSNVFYRYGSFAGKQLVSNSGKTRKDRREPGAAVPSWVVDPFTRENKMLWQQALPLAPQYLTYRALSQRGKGGVYEALDLSISPPRRVIIKEGRRHGETGWDRLDGYDRILHETRILRRLRAAGLAIPQVHRAFSRNGNRYLALEKISGPPLLSPGREQPTRTSWKRAQQILDRLEPVLAQMHAAGLVWRDCKPSHIFFAKDAVRLIDFEGACAISETDLLPWASLHYSPPAYRHPFAKRRAGTLEDNYALGVIAFQFLAGKFPPGSSRARATIYRRTNCPASLRATIERLLANS